MRYRFISLNFIAAAKPFEYVLNKLFEAKLDSVFSKYKGVYLYFRGEENNHFFPRRKLN